MTALLDVPQSKCDRDSGLRDYVSWSELSTYQSCPLKHHFRYALRLPEPTVSSSLVFGSAIHAALQFHFDALMIGNGATDLDGLLYAYQAAWQGREEQEVRFGKSETVDTLGRLAERMLTAFQNSDFAKPSGRIIGVEEELRDELIPGYRDLLARVDLIVDEGETLVVVDAKTSRSKWSVQQAELNGEQLVLYSHLVRRLAPEKKLRLEYQVISKAKEPTVTRHEVHLDEHQLDRNIETARRVMDSMSSGPVYPSPSIMNCSGCPYQTPCRKWSG